MAQHVHDDAVQKAILEIIKGYINNVNDHRLDEDNPSMIYKVRELHESNSGLKHVHFWGFNDSVPLNDEVKLMIDGKIVNWD